MEALFTLIIGIVIVVVSVMNQKKRREALAAEARRRQQALAQAPGPQAEGEAGQAQPDLQATLGDILRQLGAAPPAEEPSQAAAEAPVEPEEAAPEAAQSAPQPAKPQTARWVPADTKYRKAVIAEDYSGAEDAAGREKKAAARRGAVIRDDQSGDFHAGSQRPREAEHKQSLIQDEYSGRPETLVTAASAAPGTVPPGMSAFATRFANAQRDQIRDGVIWAEILGKPLALRDQ